MNAIPTNTLWTVIYEIVKKLSAFLEIVPSLLLSNVGMHVHRSRNVCAKFQLLICIFATTEFKQRKEVQNDPPFVRHSYICKTSLLRIRQNLTDLYASKSWTIWKLLSRFKEHGFLGLHAFSAGFLQKIFCLRNKGHHIRIYIYFFNLIFNCGCYWII